MGLDQFIARIGRYMLNVHRGNREIYDYIRQTEKHMRRSADEQRAYQTKAVIKMVNHAYSKSAFYKRKFDEVGFSPGDLKSLDDLNKLPIIQKEDLVEHMDEVLCEPKETLSEFYTGGTTGFTHRFYRNHQCQLYRRGIDLAIARYYGWKYGQWQAWLWGAPRDVLDSKGWRAQLLKNWMERYYFLDISDLSTKNYQAFVDASHNYKPSFVSAYPSLAHDLAIRIEEGSVEPVRFPVISLTAEPIYDFQRIKIAKILADEVYERYGAREFGTTAFECKDHNGLHLITDSAYTETVASDVPNIDHEIVLVTDLLNTAMPLIRYRIGDFAEIDQSPCSCGLTSPRIMNIQGREADIIWRADGTGISGNKIIYISSLTKIDARLQFVQTALDQIEIRYEGSPEKYLAILNEMVDSFKKIVGDDIQYKLIPVEKIELAKSGKYRYVISNVARPGSKN